MREGSLEGDDNGHPIDTQALVALEEPAGELTPREKFEAQQWKPGQSGNPAGGNAKPRGLAKRVRDVFGDDPVKIVQVLYDIVLDDRARNADRITAARELLDRGYGKAPSHAPIEGGDPLEMTDLDRAIRVIADELEKRARDALPIVEHAIRGSETS